MVGFYDDNGAFMAGEITQVATGLCSIKRHQANSILGNMKPNLLSDTFPTLVISSAQLDGSASGISMRHRIQRYMDILDQPGEEFVAMIGRANRGDPLGERVPLKGWTIQRFFGIEIDDLNISGH